jgi:hypothetical protein
MMDGLSADGFYRRHECLLHPDTLGIPAHADRNDGRPFSRWVLRGKIRNLSLVVLVIDVRHSGIAEIGRTDHPPRRHGDTEKSGNRVIWRSGIQRAAIRKTLPLMNTDYTDSPVIGRRQSDEANR